MDISLSSQEFIVSKFLPGFQIFHPLWADFNFRNSKSNGLQSIFINQNDVAFWLDL